MNHTGHHKNPATTKGVKRIRRSAWCCGHNFQTWRLRSRGYPSHPVNCPDCGKPLDYRLVKNPSLDRYYRNRDKQWAVGRTTTGTKPRRMNPKIQTPQEKLWAEFRAAIPSMASIEDVFSDRNSVYETQP
jgi:hypothetical protein